jgi:hypothetical protein
VTRKRRSVERGNRFPLHNSGKYMIIYDVIVFAAYDRNQSPPDLFVTGNEEGEIVGARGRSRTA